MKMKTSALNRSHTGAHLSAGSSLGNSALGHTGVNNSMFASAHLGSNTMAGHSNFFTRSTIGHPFNGSRFNRGFGRGFFNDHDFDDFGFRCFGCGFGFGFGPGFGFGFGFGWGWGGWWDPWWWEPSRGWAWAPPPPPAQRLQLVL
jgi:hypothetical protein